MQASLLAMICVGANLLAMQGLLVCWLSLAGKLLQKTVLLWEAVVGACLLAMTGFVGASLLAIQGLVVCWLSLAGKLLQETSMKWIPLPTSMDHVFQSDHHIRRGIFECHNMASFAIKGEFHEP